MLTESISRSDEGLLCRICQDETNQDDLISPCLCSGSIKWVHRHCLDKWRSLDPTGKRFSQCQMCLHYYEYEEITSETRFERCHQHFLYYGHLILDLCLIIMLFHTAILAGMFIVLLSGSNLPAQISNELGCSIDSAAYLLGWAFALMGVGLVGLIIALPDMPNHRATRGCIFIYCDEQSRADSCVVCVIVSAILLIVFGLFIGTVYVVITLRKRCQIRAQQYLLHRQTEEYIVKDRGPVLTEIVV